MTHDDVTHGDLPDRDVAVVLDLAAVRAPRCGRTRIVAVDGPSGSGKTTCAGRLAEALLSRSGIAPQVVHMDDLYPGWDGLAAAVPRLVAGVLAPLAAGRAGRYRRWDWAAGRDGDAVRVPAADWLVVEGAGCGARAAASSYVVLVWLDAPADERRRRGLARDGDTYAPHWERWAAQERAHFASEGTAARADLRLGS